MFETIFIGTSGLLNHEKGLRVVGNNLANVNTPGYKSSQLQFAEVFERGGAGIGQQTRDEGQGVGTGVAANGTAIDFRAGLDQSTGNPLDLRIDGSGFYAIERDGQTLYTRAGEFHFDAAGVLLSPSGDRIMGLGSGGELAAISLDGLERSLPKATTKISFNGNLTTTVATPPVNTTINSIGVFDAAGGLHTLNLSFLNNGGGDFTVTVTDAAGGATLGTGSLKFAEGFPIAGSDKISVTYAAAGTQAFPIELDFSKGVFAQAAASSMNVTSKDGYTAGVRTDQSIDASGTLVVSYSNGQTAKGARLALANFDSINDLTQTGGSAFARTNGSAVSYGYAGDGAFGKLVAGHREGSNVDLAEEFSNLILMQRGYQASSHVISTANDMIQELFDMKGR